MHMIYLGIVNRIGGYSLQNSLGKFAATLFIGQLWLLGDLGIVWVNIQVNTVNNPKERIAGKYPQSIPITCPQ